MKGRSHESKELRENLCQKTCPYCAMAPNYTAGGACSFCYLHFTNKETKTQKSLGIYPVSHSVSLAEQRLEIKGIIEMYRHYPGVWSEKVKIIQHELHRKGWRKESSLMYYFFFFMKTK